MKGVHDESLSQISLLLLLTEYRSVGSANLIQASLMCVHLVLRASSTKQIQAFASGRITASREATLQVQHSVFVHERGQKASPGCQASYGRPPPPLGTTRLCPSSCQSDLTGVTFSSWKKNLWSWSGTHPCTYSRQSNPVWSFCRPSRWRP